MKKIILSLLAAALFAGCSFIPTGPDALAPDEAISALIVDLQAELNRTTGRDLSRLFSASMIGRANWTTDAAFKYSRLGQWNGPFTVEERGGGTFRPVNGAGVYYVVLDVYAVSDNADNRAWCGLNIVMEDGTAKILALQNSSAVYCGMLVFWI